MSSQPRGPREWSTIITEAYGAGTKPPLTDDLVLKVDKAVLDACTARDGTDAFGDQDVARINEALDQFEQALDAVTGPRLVTVDTGTGLVKMRHRSEADHPLRAFGGQ